MRTRKKLEIHSSPPLPAIHCIQEAIAKLRVLRRQLCYYANSDERCDCKRLTPADSRFEEPHEPGGEFSGCVEVREAILRLTIIERAYLGKDMMLFCGHCQSEVRSDSTMTITDTGEGQGVAYRHRICGRPMEPLGMVANCFDCNGPLHDPTACFPWSMPLHARAGLRSRVVDLCCSCHEKRLRA